MKMKSILFVSLIFASALCQIEIPLYKSPLAYEELKKSDAMIDDIDRTHFLADLNMGTPSRAYPLQVEMATDEVYIVNENFKPERDFLSKKTSESFQAEEKEEGAYESPAKDKISFGDKNFELKFESSERIMEEPLNSESSGILGLSLGDVQSKEKDKENKRFTEQLEQNKVTKSSAFYFEFDEVKVQPSCKVPTLKEYLGIKGKVYIGDFPYNVPPNQCDKKGVKTAQVIQVIKC